MKTVVINENDWEDLREIRLASLKESPEAFCLSYQEAISYTSEDWKLRASEKEGPRFLITYKDTAPIGIIGGVFANEEYELIAMWVTPECRSSGVGVQLVEALKDHASSLGHTNIMLRVSLGNEAACRLYAKCGFSVVGKAGALVSDDNIKLHKMVWQQLPSLNKKLQSTAVSSA